MQDNILRAAVVAAAAALAVGGCASTPHAHPAARPHVSAPAFAPNAVNNPPLTHREATP